MLLMSGINTKQLEESLNTGVYNLPLYIFHNHVKLSLPGTMYIS